MTIQQLDVFAENGEKNTSGLTIGDGFPVATQPSRQWFNWLFNKLFGKTNEVIAGHNALTNEFNSFKQAQLTKDSAQDGAVTALTTALALNAQADVDQGELASALAGLNTNLQQYVNTKISELNLFTAEAALSLFCPIGTKLMCADNPQTRGGVFANTTWALYAEGRGIVGMANQTGNADIKYRTHGATYGSDTVTLNATNMPAHFHVFPGDDQLSNTVADRFGSAGAEPYSGQQYNYDASSGGAAGSAFGRLFKTTTAGGNLDGSTQPFSILPPSITTAIWVRVS